MVPWFSITLDETLSLALKHVARTQETTPFVLMLTAFQLVLMRYAQQQRLVIGMPVSGRIRPNCRVALVIMPALRLSTPILMGLR